MFRKILVAVDDSAIAAHAAETGVRLARSVGAELGFIHVVDTSEAYAPETGVAAADVIAIEVRAGKKLLERLGRRAEGTPTTVEFAAVGNPALEVARAAKEWPADVIVIGSHGRGGLRRVLMGSVAEGVMRHAPCPVLVVRGAE